MPSTCGCAPRKSWWQARARAAQALLAAARALPSLDRVVLEARAADALPQAHPARAKIEAGNAPQAFVCVGERCSLPVTDAAALTRTIASMRHA